MIKQVHIQNFKCLRDVTVELEPFTVLIGPNDSGKSSFLQACQVVAANNAQIPKSLHWQCNEANKVVVELVRGDGVLRRFEEGVGSTSGNPNGHSGPPISPSFGEYRFNPRLLRSIAGADPQPVLSTEGDNLAAVLNAILVSHDRDTILEMERQLHAAIPTLQGLATPTVDSTGATRRIEFALAGDKKPRATIPSEQASDGAMLVTAFLALAYTETADVLLIEEPENGLHPSRLESVIALLRKITTGEVGNRPRQVILTTHSPLLLNFVEPKEVRIFQRGADGATTICRMDDVPDIDRLTQDFSTGELWHMFGEERLVEGAPA